MARPQLLSGARGLIQIFNRESQQFETIAYSTDINISVRSNVRPTYVMGRMNAGAIDTLAYDVEVSIGRVVPVNAPDAAVGVGVGRGDFPPREAGARVAHPVDEELPAEERQERQRHGRRVQRSRGEDREPLGESVEHLPGHSGLGFARRCQASTPSAVATSRATSQRREATASSSAGAGPTAGDNSATSAASRTPMPPGAKTARMPAT